MSSAKAKNSFLKRVLLSAAVVFTAAVFTGCKSANPDATTKIDDFDYQSVINNHLTLMDFAHHLQDSGVKVTQVQPIRADVLGRPMPWQF